MKNSEVFISYSFRHRRYIWQNESYDHVVQDHGEFEWIVNYVLGNPLNTGLVSKSDWQHRTVRSAQVSDLLNLPPDGSQFRGH
jgi:hypothetical protein